MTEDPHTPEPFFRSKKGTQKRELSCPVRLTSDTMVRAGGWRSNTPMSRRGHQGGGSNELAFR